MSKEPKEPILPHLPGSECEPDTRADFSDADLQRAFKQAISSLYSQFGEDGDQDA